MDANIKSAGYFFGVQDEERISKIDHDFLDDRLTNMDT